MSRFVVGLSAVLALVFLASPASAGFCVGVNCGANDASFHCHSENALGNQCWDQFDDACEAVPGFSRAEAFPCNQTGGNAAVAGGVGGQLGVAVGGVNVFRSQIRQPATSNLARQQEEASQEAQDLENDTEGGAEGEDGVSAKDVIFFTDISAALEYETWDFLGAEGTTSGLSFGWQRTKDSGGHYGISASYQQADPDGGGDSLDVINAGFDIGHSIGNSKIWKWSLGATVSSFSGFFELSTSTRRI